jgi:PAT family beta-lactamase induction signal transducer AmpG
MADAAAFTPGGGRGRAFLRDYVIQPFTEFASRPGWISIMALIVLYKFADAFLGVMTNPFLIDIGFSKGQIAAVVKLYGLVATLAGAFIGGALVLRMGLMRSLWIGVILNGLTNLLFLWQARAGADVGVLAVVITAENFSGGLTTAAFVAYLGMLCNARFTATQYALLSSLSAFARTWLSTPAGVAAERLGWEGFFVFSALLALPSLLVLSHIQRRTPH